MDEQDTENPWQHYMDKENDNKPESNNINDPSLDQQIETYLNEGKTPEEIADEVKAKLNKKPEISNTEAELRAIAKSVPALGGWASQIEGAIRTPFNDKSYRDNEKDAYQKNQDSLKQHPVKTLGTQLALSGPMALTRSLGPVGTAVNALESGIYAAGESRHNLYPYNEAEYGGVLNDAKEGAALGAVSPHVLNAILKRMGPGVAKEKVANYLEGLAGRQSVRAMGGERGTIKKLHLENPEKLQELGHYGLDEGIVKLGNNTREMVDANDAKLREGGSLMGKVQDKIDDAGVSDFNPHQVANRVDKEKGDFWRTPINQDVTRHFDNMLKTIKGRIPETSAPVNSEAGWPKSYSQPQKNIPIKDAQKLTELIAKVGKFRGASEPTPKQKIANETYGIVNDEKSQSIQRAQEQLGDPTLTADFNRGKKLYGNSSAASELLTNKDAREQGNRIDSLSDWEMLGPGIAAHSHATVPAYLAKKGFERYGSRAMAVGANKLSDELKRFPEQFGRFQGPLKKALERGDMNLAATHYILQQMPDYRKEVMDKKNEKELSEE